ncbi:hypothetical protein PLESTB_001595200 [Pleodorina starrii]|uniref:Uncharacterized protein n=1 Tax=Pleodorina starrii TaxID=330485 RepID=A0A9W6BXY8_9CHLO|nr:hypothetical protein PLESTM_000575800 [Pleodorina starrii]GLC60293.1 hypothetical protein PLESTB_001595200 [Pleodorina starrii]GLC66054.1 hypothetical protein PLESTF_000376700 [Pleodorina starrii]
MDAEAELCTRCGVSAVTYDHEGSCFVCESCGYVSQQQGLAPYQDDHQQAHPVGGQVAVTAAYATEAGQPAGGALPLGSFGAGTEAAARCVGGGSDRARAQRQRRSLDELQGLAATLRLPGPVTQLAAGFLARIHQAAAETAAARQHGGCLETGAEAEADGGREGSTPGDAWDSDDGDDDDGAGAEVMLSSEHAGASAAASSAKRSTPGPPAMGGQHSAARLGALLYLAARSERGTLTLAEVAMATATDMYRVGEMARQQASFLRLSLPAVDVERFVVRIARELVASGALQPLPLQQTAAAGHEGGGGGAAAAAAAPVSETAVWSHPLVRRALQLTGLVLRRGWHEGRTPRTVAGALLSICLDSLYPQRTAGGAGGAGPGGGGSLTVTQLSRAAMCAESQLYDLKQEIVGRLLRLASGLPFGPLVAPSNVAAYLEVIVAADQVVEGLAAQ